MVKTRVTSRGIISEPGSGFEGQATSVPSQTKTGSATLTAQEAGLTILSASQGVLTMVLPAVASAPGATFIIRTSSPSAHVLTSSQDAGNVINTRPTILGGTGILGAPSATGSNASQLAFPAIVGSSVALMCDGVNWLLIGGSGSFTPAKGV